MFNFFENVFILFILIDLCSNIIVIPFKTYQKEPNKFSSPSDIFTYWGNNIIYSTTLIGTPPQNITLILHSQTFSSTLFYHMCDIPFSQYEKDESSSYIIEKSIHSYSTMQNASVSRETLYLYNDLSTKKLKPYKSFSFIYSPNSEKDQGTSYEYHPYTCLNIGFQLGWRYINDNQANFISQLKKIFNETETYDFTIEYTTKTEGRIVIGTEPHFYNKEVYSELQYRIAGAVSNEGINQNDFFLNFDDIYVPYKNKNTGKSFNESISMTRSAKIVIDKGLIYAPNSYRSIIDNYFFNDMKKERKCEQKDINDEYTVYYCDKTKSEEDIKNNFPNLYLEMKQFNKIFVLTYEDLFRVKNDEIYFLIYFRRYNFGNYFELGKIFLQKYSFTFNQQTKMIGYYNFDLPGGKKPQKNSGEDEQQNYLENIYIWLGIGAVLIVFGILGFFIGKFFYDRARKKRMNEVVDDNYDYNPQQNIDKNQLIINE